MVIDPVSVLISMAYAALHCRRCRLSRRRLACAGDMSASTLLLVISGFLKSQGIIARRVEGRQLVPLLISTRAATADTAESSPLCSLHPSWRQSASCFHGDFRELAKPAHNVAGVVSHYSFAAPTGYFDGNVDNKPAAHLWSLTLRTVLHRCSRVSFSLCIAGVAAAQYCRL